MRYEIASAPSGAATSAMSDWKRGGDIEDVRDGARCQTLLVSCGFGGSSAACSAKPGSYSPIFLASRPYFLIREENGLVRGFMLYIVHTSEAFSCI